MLHHCPAAAQVRRPAGESLGGGRQPINRLCWRHEHISYVGLFEGAYTKPLCSPGYVMMEASLIWYQRRDAVADNKF